MTDTTDPVNPTHKRPRRNGAEDAPVHIGAAMWALVEQMEAEAERRDR